MNTKDIIKQAQAAQLANPRKAIVNSECAFVQDAIYDMGHKALAAEYWSWVCGPADRGCLKYGEEVLEQYRALRAIDKGYTMPEWGTYGT